MKEDFQVFHTSSSIEGCVKPMTLSQLKELVDREINNGNGDAIIMVQANRDGISDIVITDFEGCGHEFGNPEAPLVFGLESN